MPRPRNEQPRVIGPTWIAKQQYWRVVVVTPDAKDPKERKVSRYHREKTDADEDAKDAWNLINRSRNVTVNDAIDAYDSHLQEKGTIGYQETIRRLRLFFPEPSFPVSRITPERAAELYESFRQRKQPDKLRKDGKPRRDAGKPISVSYHRAALINARSFLRWCIKQGWVMLNAFDGIEGVGRRNAGKEQHTGTETQKLYRYCMARAQASDDAALAVLMALLMALRSGDITRRIVRDVDLDATVLRVWNGKTKKSNRPRRIPVVLQPLLRRLTEGRQAFEPLFKTPFTDDGHHTRRWLEEAMVRFCAGAYVPYVCPHALKGTAGTLAAEMGELADRIADHLSHEETATTTRHYVASEAVQQAQAERAFSIIAGGKK